jgi:protein-S-isoprenylcysteine O-methyltransferase Ste14
LLSSSQSKSSGAGKTWKWENIFWSTIITILCIVCFPANPLVLTGVIETETYLPLVILGSFTWVLGMALVLAPVIMFPRRGGVSRGKSFVSTTRLVDSGIYAIVRHPQYTGGVYSIFVTTPLLYPHWLFGLLGAIGIVVIYIGCKEEDKRLIEKFGDEYKDYMERVPGMNVFAGLTRLIKNKSKRS